MPNPLLTRLEALEAAVASLTSTRKLRRNEALQPSYALFNPATGQFGALFTGGVLLNEAPSAVNIPANSLSWQDSGDVIRSWITGINTGGGIHEIDLVSQVDGTDQGILRLITQTLGGAGATQLIALLTDNSGATSSRLISSSSSTSDFIQKASIGVGSASLGDAALIYATANSTAAPAANATYEPFAQAGVTHNVFFDDGSRFGAGGASNYRYVCRTSGIYLCVGSAAYNGAAAATFSVGIRNETSGSQLNSPNVQPATIGVGGSSIAMFMLATAGDQLSLVAYNTAAEVVEFADDSNTGATWFGCVRIR